MALMCLALLPAAGCGDDDDEAATTGETTATETAPATETETTPAQTDTEPDEADEGEGDGGEAPPEEQPGGAGDEEPAQTQVVLTGRDGKVTPRRVTVAPFIAIRIELRSADGGRYGFNCGNPIIVDREIETASTRVAGRRAGQFVDCISLGDHNSVVITASNEAGP